MNFDEYLEEALKDEELRKEYDKLTRKQVKVIYRQLAKVNHPDQGGCEEKFKQVKYAYERAMQRVA